MTVSGGDLREMYRRMSRIRQFEATTKELLLAGELYGAFHTSTGQEASIVGACMALRERRLHGGHASLARASHRQGGGP